MRYTIFALLVILLFISAIKAAPPETTAQPPLAAGAWANLIQAFQSVQEADRAGVSHQDIVQLSTDLNTALEDYGNATQLSLQENMTGAKYYARLSNQTSTAVASTALALRGEAQSQKVERQSIAYIGAGVASVVSTLLVMEFHRIPNFVRKRKLLKAKLG